MDKIRVVITGMGMVTPLGNSVLETWQNLIAGKSGIGPLTKFDPAEYKGGEVLPRLAGEVKNFNLADWGVDRKSVRRLDPFSQYALAASIEAVRDSKLDPKEENPWQIGLYIGSCLGGLTTLINEYKTMIEKGCDRVSPFLVTKLMLNRASSEGSIYFGIKGPNITNTTACATGGHAIGSAFDLIHRKRAKVMIAGGAEAVIIDVCLSAFNQAGALSHRNDCPEKASRPFDKDRDGFVMAEGAGVMVLEQLEHALKRRAKIYAELVGVGMTGDAFDNVKPDVEGQRECMKFALQEAELRPEEVDYINAHGTSTEIGDKVETESIKQVFGAHAYRLAVSSTKSATGHMLGAAGAVGAIFTVLSIHHGIIPPTLNLDNPDPECDLDYVPHQARKADVRVAMSNSFGFGGTNAVLVFKKFEGA